MERMELNLPQLQFLFNVIAITATASLALICILLKRDKNKLTSELNRRRVQDPNQPSVSALEQGPDREPSVSTLEQAPNPRSSCPLAPDALEIMRQDIRQYAARRVQGRNVEPRTR